MLAICTGILSIGRLARVSVTTAARLQRRSGFRSAVSNMDKVEGGRGERPRSKKRTWASAAAPAIMAPMVPLEEVLDVKEFDKMNDEMKAYDEKREAIVVRTREVLKSSKNAIFALHRGDMERAASLLEKARDTSSELAPTIEEEPSLRSGAYASCMEEYGEARAFEHFLLQGSLIPKSMLPLCDRTEYLCGVCDFTGELGRYAVAQATIRNVEAVERCRYLTESILGKLLEFDLRNGALRKKYDSIKWNLKKMETILYELSLTSAGKITKGSEIEQEETETAAATTEAEKEE